MLYRALTNATVERDRPLKSFEGRLVLLQFTQRLAQIVLGHG